MSHNIPKQVAAHVLHHFGADGGKEPGTFTTALLEAIASADLANKTKLAQLFPGHVAAVIAAQANPDGITRLQSIAAGIRCTRCDDTDGPFERQPNGWLCEGCIKPGGNR